MGKKVIKVCFICHGNICRSTMCEFVFSDMVNKRGLGSNFHIDSAATSTEEIGNGVHYGTRRKLQQEGIPMWDHRARQMTRRDYDAFDYIIGMDQWNMRNMRRIVRDDKENKLHLLLDYTDEPRDIADPWYTGDFDATYRDVTAGCEALLDHILQSGNVKSF